MLIKGEGLKMEERNVKITGTEAERLGRQGWRMQGEGMYRTHTILYSSSSSFSSVPH